MPRIALQCGCGWSFFIPESTSAEEVPCPSCGRGIRTASGTVVTARYQVEEQASLARLHLLYKALGALVVVGLVVALFLSARPVRTTAPPPPRPVVSAPAPRPAAPPPLSAPPPAVPAPVPAVPPTPREAPVRLHPAELGKLRRSIGENTALTNLGGIVAEVLRLRGMAEPHARVAAQVAEWNDALNAALSRLADHGERVIVDPHFQPGDQIVGIARRDLASMPPIDAANVLALWLASFRAPTPSEQIVFLRHGRPVTDYISFVEETEAMRRLLQTPGIAPTAAAVATPGFAPFPPSLLEKIRSRLGELPKGYRGLLPDGERRRLDLLCETRLGTSDDLAFLEVRILAEAIPQFEKDAAAVRLRAAELEKKLAETTAIDVLHFKDGRRIEGQLLEETQRHVKFKGRFGAVQFPLEEILRVERGRGAGLEFPEKLKAAGLKLEALAPLLEWCRERKLSLETELVACRILTIDPLHEGARTASGIRRPASRP